MMLFIILTAIKMMQSKNLLKLRSIVGSTIRPTIRPTVMPPVMPPIRTLFTTINEGQTFMVTNKTGKTKIVDGPKYMMTFGKKIYELQKITVGPNEVLIIHKTDGSIDMLKGPNVIVKNPLIHENIEKVPIKTIKENNAILVHTSEPDGKISSELIVGPNQYFQTGNTITIKEVKTHIVNDNEHAVVFLLDGQHIIVNGPETIYEDPRKIKSVVINKNLTIDINDAYVIFEKSDQNNTQNDTNFNSYMLTGPTEFKPNTKFMYYKKLPLHVVDSGSYAVISYHNGKVEHLKGPISFHQDMRTMKNVEINPITRVASNETMVVYASNVDNGQILRKIIKGPISFIPDPNDIIHKFSWSGHDGKNELNLKIRNMVKFERLKQMPHQMYLDVPNVRTKDDVLLTIKMIVFFDLTDLEKMLDNTNDPIANISIGVGADIIKTISKFTFSEFKDSITLLNNVEHYEELLKTSRTIGITPNSVVFRGYLASGDLQKLHNDSVIKRTQLTIDNETQNAKQLLEKDRLNAALNNFELESKLAIERANLGIKVATIENEQKVIENIATQKHYSEMSKILDVGEYHKHLSAKGSQLIRVEGNATPIVNIK